MQQTLEVNVLKSEVKFRERGGDEAREGELGAEMKAQMKEILSVEVKGLKSRRARRCRALC